MFDNNHRYTAAASQLDQEVTAALELLFRRYMALGYSPRDIFLIVSHAAFDLEHEALLVNKDVEAQELR